MARRALDLIFIGWTVALLVSGCTNSPNDSQQTAATIPSVTFKGPTTNSSNPNVRSIDSAVAVMNSYSQQLSVLRNLTAVGQGNTQTWTYNRFNTLTINLIATGQADGSHRWAMVLNGKDTSGATYQNFTVVRGTTSGDGSSGTWDVYDSTSASPLSELKWSTTNNVLNGSLRSFTGTSVIAQTAVINNPDNSGQLTLYAGTALAFKTVWQQNGSGNWWTYDLNGVQTGTGNWN